MAETRLKVVLETSGAGKLKAARRESAELAEALNRVGVQGTKAASGIRATGRSALAANRGVRSLTGAVRNLVAAFISVRTAATVFNESIERTESVRRINLLAKSYGEVEGLLGAAERSAKKFGIGITEANNALAGTFARLRPLGTSLKDIESIYGGFNTAAKLSGANALEASTAFRQLSQALGSGRLAGDEFRSISETIPSILTAISKELNVSVGALKEMGSEGLLSSEVIIKALKQIEKDGADKVAESLEGPRQKLIDLQNAGENLAVALGDTLLPEFIKLVESTTDFVKELEKIVVELDQLPEPVKQAATAFGLLGAAIASISIVGGVVGAIGGGIGLAGQLDKVKVAATGAKTALAGIGGGTKTIAVGWTAAGTAITKTTTAVTAATVAVGALKFALAALAIGATIAIVKNIYDEIEKTNRLLNGSTDELEELESEIDILINRMTTASLKTRTWYEDLLDFVLGVDGAADGLDGLNGKLEEYIKKRDMLRSQKKFDDMDNEKDRQKEGFDMDIVNQLLGEGEGDLPTTTPKGSAPKVKEDPIPGLLREVRLSDELKANKLAMLDAQLAENKEQIQALEYDRIAIELEGQLREIDAEAIEDKAKLLKAALAINQADEKRAELQNDIASKRRDEAANAEKVLRGLNGQTRLLQAKLDGNEAQVRLEMQLEEILGRNKTLTEDEVRAILEGNKALEERYKLKLEKERELREAIGMFEKAFNDSVIASIEAAVSGTEDLADSLQNIASNLLKSLGSFFLNKATGGLGDGLFNMFKRASGGPVTNNQPYMVGEQGPEMFVPSQDGAVTTNRDLMQTYNGQQAAAIYSPTIQATKMGDGQEYVTVAQMNSTVQAGMRVAARDGAALGESRTFATLKNSRSQRSKIGLR